MPSGGDGPPPGYVAGVGRGVRVDDRGRSTAYISGLRRGKGGKGKGKGKGGKDSSAGGAGVSGTGNGVAPASISRQALLEFYDKYDPSKKANVDTILANFSAEQIEQNLITKYGDAPRIKQGDDASEDRLQAKWKAAVVPRSYC